mmetsp:Transcript_13137/g.19840  ORF Transcript_13137/g.19840 Transcript_13137/m.19840 type:complete len:204 (-) Transcript_13137:81-692(-)|eukprot:CAMPEP_0201547370 /NCGR_PEP_ID=MMETSP0173_2-20130828/3854_1 /ASSEMBLY_ACC=CAM_ASM_000268 /TAXON_ID=218659 /ORGANISM="Vexillifera sp., Strain DIVA3 564/2" /LENGTH=203 /DNA_ID=CAMNT_0047956399 /DNA_START=73 /DNA_END=684 /DNA_ORIENTATION=-
MAIYNDESYRPPTNPRYRTYLCCSSICSPCVCCSLGELVDQTYVTLDENSVEFQRAYNDCCCHVATNKVNIPLENITDVGIQNGCCLDCFNIEPLTIQTAGSGGAEAVIYHVDNSAAFRERILEERNNQRQASTSAGASSSKGGGASLIMSEEPPSDPIAKVKYIHTLWKLGVLNEQEAAQARTKVMSSVEFREAKAALLKKL